MTEFTPTIFNWLLGMATAGLVGILTMNVQLWVLKQQFDDHEKHCLLKHAAHEKHDDQLWEAVDDLRKNRS